MNAKELADAFARQNAKKGKASALYFEGPICYSYGPHFPLAILKPDKRALVNRDGYSRTTAKHKSIIRAALARNGWNLDESKDTDEMKEIAARIHNNGAW